MTIPHLGDAEASAAEYPVHAAKPYAKELTNKANVLGGVTMLNVGLLGVFRVAGVDNRTWSELGPAGRGLASFLFTYPGRPHRRERLADLFWPELDAERARRDSAIWRLRKLLASEPESGGGDSLQTVGSETVLAPAPWLDIDASALEHAATLVLKQSSVLDDGWR
jgi:DNA-binding SARP family transcriptional activator